MAARLLLTATILAATAAAQSVFVPDNDASSGACNIVPFGTNTRSGTYSNQRHQQMVTVADFGSRKTATICDLAWSSCVAGIRHFDEIEIRMGQTKANGLSRTFANNMVTNVQTVLKAAEYDWHHGADSWDRIGLDTSYQWQATEGNLVIEVITRGSIVYTASSTFPGMHHGSRDRVYTRGWNRTPPPTGVRTARAVKIELAIEAHDLGEFGAGCTGSNGTPTLKMSGSARLGGTCNVELARAPKSGPVLLSIGLQRQEPALDMKLIGARDCWYAVPNHITLPLTSSSSGRASLPLKIPNDPRLVCGRIYFQWFPRDASANKLGLTSSNYGRLLIGR